MYLFLERGEERERGRETSMCERNINWLLSHTPYWRPGPQPRHVPWLGIELANFWFAGQHSIHWAPPAGDVFPLKVFSNENMKPGGMKFPACSYSRILPGLDRNCLWHYNLIIWLAVKATHQPAALCCARVTHQRKTASDLQFHGLRLHAAPGPRALAGRSDDRDSEAATLQVL